MSAIKKGYKQNFETLLQAAKHGHLAILDCQDKKTGKPVVAIVAVNFDGKEYSFAPLAKMFDGNPYEELNPPSPDAPGGYVTDCG